MVKVGGLFRHLEDCTPGKNIYVGPVTKSRSARLVYQAPKWVGKLLRNMTGRVAIEYREDDGTPVGHGWRKVR